MGKTNRKSRGSLRKSSVPPKISNRNRTNKPIGSEEERNAIADDLKSAIAAYNRLNYFQRAYDQNVLNGIAGNYGEDGFLIQKEYESGYESLADIDPNENYDSPILKRVSKSVVINQDESSGQIKVVKDKNYYKG